MSFHWSGLANNLGIVIFAVVNTIWYILIGLATLFAIAGIASPHLDDTRCGGVQCQ